jgi:hypothetical protein
MSQNEIHNIDELLNSFLDGELDQRQQTEVQRLLKHDKQIAERLRMLRNCRQLVGSLPYAEAPDGMLENIKASLEEKKTSVSTVEHISPSAHQQRQGVRHLFLRQLAAAAAMFALVAVLAAVIYSVVAPEVTIAPADLPVAVEQPAEIRPQEVAVVEKPAETTLPAVLFTGQLELKTDASPEVAAFLNKTIEFNIPANQRSLVGPQQAFTLNCTMQNLKALLEDLDTIWGKIDSATLLVQTNTPEGRIVVDAVTPEQIIEIAKQDNSQLQIKTANNVSERLPGKEVQVAIDDSAPPLMTIPKPVLTSNEKPVTKTAGGAEAKQNALLTIVVTGK